MPIHFFARLLLLMLAFMAPLAQAHAELIDNSKSVVMTEEQLQQYYAQTFATRRASWKIKPNFHVPHRVSRKAKTGTIYTVKIAMDVDKQGNISKVKIVESSGNVDIDKTAVRSIQRAKFYPFVINGEAVQGSIVIPIQFQI